MNRYGDEEHGKWGGWHNVGPKPHESGEAIMKTVVIEDYIIMSGISEGDRVSLCILTEPTQFWFRNTMMNQTNSYMHHSPKGRLCYLSGNEEDANWSLTFHWKAY